ncbi:MAG: DDE-type integrase/transposase/recombinase, partial [Candidatus Thiodiazotropha endolucinida]|nr:DDE-type integrase/transposase/recombinase [Candidatus Thiodiazotropha taylori]MCW4343375.1 DDE-type integrase/transposase/recombinase [Candidatus Thiodiazotropha endolucinida]
MAYERRKTDFHTLESKSWFLKSLINQWSRLSIKQDLLVRRWDELGTGRVIWQAIVPLSLRREALKFAHDIKASAHLGIKKTLSKLRQKYYWPGLQNDVKVYVGGCKKCSRKKNPNPNKIAPMQVVRSGFPMERLAMDILGELPMTERGNKYILVISDYFTKWTESFPMANMEAKTCAAILVQEVITRFGVPNKIHSDQGRQFEIRLFAELCEMLQIEKTRTTPYHPQSDGMVERFNRTLCTMLSTLVDENQRNWDTLLPFVMMAYRSAAHETVGMSPNALMLGRETSTPLDIQFEMPHFMKAPNVNDYVWEVKENLETSHTFVREFTGMSMFRQKQYHDMKSNYNRFMPDEYVYVYFPVTKTGQSAKLTSFWRGPYKIESKISDVLYKINCGRNRTPQVIHVDRLKKAKEQRLVEEPEVDQISRDQPLDQDVGGESLDVSAHEDSAAPVDEEDEPEVSYSKYGRQRRKPVWLTDYVSSIFSKTDTMVKTKKTPRKPEGSTIICPNCKQNIQGQNFNNHISICTNTSLQGKVCPVCKEEVKGQSFENHLYKCASSRPTCQVCSKTFKKTEYLKQHMKRAHKAHQDAPAVGHKRSWALTKDLSLSSSTEDSDSDKSGKKNDSDWNDEPDIEISDEAQLNKAQSKIVEKDERLVRNLQGGRVIRKPFDPSPVLAPIKRKKVEEMVTSATSGEKAVNTLGSDKTDLDRKGSADEAVVLKDENRKDVKKKDSSTENCSPSIKDTECEVDFNVTGKDTSQTLTFTKDGNQLFSSTSR